MARPPSTMAVFLVGAALLLLGVALAAYTNWYAELASEEAKVGLTLVYVTAVFLFALVTMVEFFEENGMSPGNWMGALHGTEEI